MNTVVPIRGEQASVLDSEEVVDVDPTEFKVQAMATFTEMVEGGCSFADCITAVYMAGMDHVAGVRLKNKAGKPAIPPCPYDAIVAMYHQHLPNLPKVKLMDAKRKAALRTFWVFIFESHKADGSKRATNAQQALEWIGEYLLRATGNDLIMGRTKKTAEHQGWRADIEFVFSARGLRHVIEKTEAT